MILLKYRDHNFDVPKSSCGIGGRFKLEKFVRHHGKEIITYAGPWFHNLITDSGMNFFGDNLRPTGSFLTACSIGTGTAAPSVADTALGAFLASTQDTRVHTTAGGTSASGATVSPTTLDTIESVSPYRAARITTWEFPPGIGTGIIAEVGVSNNFVPASQVLFSRELIRDGVGAPTTIQKLADEFLRVIYDFGTLVSLTDVTGNLVLQSVSYAYTMRPSRVNSLDFAGDSSGGGRVVSASTAQTWKPMQAGWGEVHTGPIGTILQNPQGTSIGPGNATSVTNTTYAAGTFLRDATSTLALASGVHPSGIGAIKVATGFYAAQIGFVPSIPKLNSQTFTLNLRTSWARA